MSAALESLREALTPHPSGSHVRGVGQVRHRLETPCRDGTTHIVLEPLDFIARLGALVPPPRVHLTRFHGVFAAHGAPRAAISANRLTTSANGFALP